MSRLFGKIVEVRNGWYDRGSLRPRRLGHPVISVGNLTTGGTGKTPLVIELAGRFREMGYRPVVLSRGYRRRTRGVLIVGRGNGPEVDWTESGDEPYLMAMRLEGVAVVVGKDRHQAGLHAQNERLGNLFILDDGFQHRRLHRDVDIVTLDPLEWNARERLLPFGRWREPRDAILRAHAACVGQWTATPALRLPVPQFDVETRIDGVVYEGILRSPDTLRDQPIVAFAGIAKPERFFGSLEDIGLDVRERRSFPDHHRYRTRDLRTLPEGFRITTEKDAVRIDETGFGFLRVSAKIREFDSLRDLILERIAPAARPSSADRS